MSNFGTPSAMGTINCELNSIIEIEIGIFGLLLSRPDRARNRRQAFAEILMEFGDVRLCENAAALSRPTTYTHGLSRGIWRNKCPALSSGCRIALIHRPDETRRAGALIHSSPV